jgi:hypothetical protein
VVVEDLVRNAFPDRTVNFTHGFLILNTGNLGPHLGAKQRLEANGSSTVGGMEMRTPRDDGWHFFDMVKQNNLSEHLTAAMDLTRIHAQPDGEDLAKEFMADQANLRLIFPNMLTHDVLIAKQKLGHFVTSRVLNGDLHVRNPQLLPNIVAQGHLLPPAEWKQGETETLAHLINLAKLISGGTDNA